MGYSRLVFSVNLFHPGSLSLGKTAQFVFIFPMFCSVMSLHGEDYSDYSRKSKRRGERKRNAIKTQQRLDT